MENSPKPVENFGIDTGPMARGTIDISLTVKGGCMEENLSWQARLAKRNINILNTARQGDKDLDVYYEFMYHPKYGQTKWCKTMTHVSGKEVEITDGNFETLPVTGDDIAESLSEEALRLRRELEG